MLGIVAGETDQRFVESKSIALLALSWVVIFGTHVSSDTTGAISCTSLEVVQDIYVRDNIP